VCSDIVLTTTSPLAGSEIPHTLVAAGGHGMGSNMESNAMMKELGKRPVFIERAGPTQLPVGTLRLAPA
jgi:hypothetical protein